MPATSTDREVLADLKDEYKYGFSQPEKYVFKSRKGLDHDIVDQISAMKREPEWMEVPPRRAGYLLLEADPNLGSRPERDRLPGHLLLHQTGGGPGQELG